MTDPAPPGACFRCGIPGHWADTCPWLAKATTKGEHEARIAKYIERWTDGDITPWQKREFISAENKLWYGGKCPPALAH